MSWEQLVRIGILGTDKGKLSEDLLLWLKEQGLDTDQAKSALILDAIAMNASVRRVATIPNQYKGTVPESAAAEEATLCSNTSVRHLNLILEGKYEAALPEFLHFLSKNNKILPPESLPTLLERCLKKKQVWQHIRTSIGKRGEWLLQHHPEWQALGAIPKAEEWGLGSKELRLKILKHYCQNHPQEVVDLLSSTWSEDTFYHKKAFLKVLAQYPNLSYEPFLENLLYDKRKEIRSIAAQILSDLPESRLVERMFQRLILLIEYKGKTFGKSKFKVSLPEEVDETLIRDGLNIKAQGLHTGLLSARLLYMMSVVPPQRWEIHFDLKRDKILEVAVRSEWSEILIQGFILASAKHHNDAWMAILLEFWMEHYEKARWSKLDVQLLLEVLSDGVFNKIATKHLATKQGFIEEADPLMLLLKSGNHLWKDKLLLLFIQNIKSWLSAQGSRYWSGWHYKGIINKVAYTCNPDLYDILWRDWNSSQTMWQGWEKQMVEFLDILKFRKEMKEALISNS